MTQRADKKVVLRNVRGLHARAAAKFVRTAQKFDAHITVSQNGHTVSGLSILGLMTLTTSKAPLRITAFGPQSCEAVEVLAQLIKNKFGENK